MTQRFTVTTRSGDETQALGRRIGEALQVGDLLYLHGNLGAGKTTLTQGIAWGAGVAGYAHSPTFVLVHQYHGRITLYHMDLYRLEGGDIEVHDLGIEEMLMDGACVVEWAEKAPDVAVADFLSVEIGFGESEDQRVFDCFAHGPRHAQLLAHLRQTVGS